MEPKKDGVGIQEIGLVGRNRQRPRAYTDLHNNRSKQGSHSSERRIRYGIRMKGAGHNTGGQRPKGEATSDTYNELCGGAGGQGLGQLHGHDLNTLGRSAVLGFVLGGTWLCVYACLCGCACVRGSTPSGALRFEDSFVPGQGEGGKG